MPCVCVLPQKTSCDAAAVAAFYDLFLHIYRSLIRCIWGFICVWFCCCHCLFYITCLVCFEKRMNVAIKANFMTFNTLWFVTFLSPIYLFFLLCLLSTSHVCVFNASKIQGKFRDFKGEKKEKEGEIILLEKRQWRHYV